MESIPSEYWMIVIGVLSALLGLILYYLAMFLKESTKTVVEVQGVVRESKEVLKKANTIADNAGVIVSSFREMSNGIQSSLSETVETILTPLQKLGSVISAIIDLLIELVTPDKKG